MGKSNVNIIKKEKSIIKNLAKCAWIIYSSIAAICIAAVTIINSTWIYKLVVKKYDLTTITGLSEQALMMEYGGLINYLQNPFIDKLEFDNFVMSTYGEVHFYEVKKIFIALMVIIAVFIMALAGWFIFNKYKKGSINIRGLLRNFNNSANLLIIFFIGIVVLYLIDFSWAFTMFHKLFFRNDYWIFDVVDDSIINILPQKYFLLCLILIMVLTMLLAIVCKIIYIRNKNSNKIKKEKSMIIEKEKQMY